MTDKKSIFNRATQQLRSTKWRTLYRAVHTIQDCATMQSDGMLIEPKLAQDILSAVSHGINPQNRRQVHDIAAGIKESMYKAIVQNGDAELPNKWWRMGITARYRFMERTIMTMNKIYTTEYKTPFNPLSKVEYEKNGFFASTMGSYSLSGRTMYLTTSGITVPFSAVIDTVAHEYTHALQYINKTSIPAYINEFMFENSHAYRNVSYTLRYTEKEARAVGKLVSKDFKRGLQQYKNQIDGRD